MGKEIRILLTESKFTQLCKMGFYTHQLGMFGKTDIYITKTDMMEIATGNILTKETDGETFMFALQDIGFELVKEILKRSPVYSEMANNINLNR